jgi:hypothetical protein
MISREDNALPGESLDPACWATPQKQALLTHDFACWRYKTGIVDTNFEAVSRAIHIGIGLGPFLPTPSFDF